MVIIGGGIVTTHEDRGLSPLYCFKLQGCATPNTFVSGLAMTCSIAAVNSALFENFWLFFFFCGGVEMSLLAFS